MKSILFYFYAFILSLSADAQLNWTRTTDYPGNRIDDGCSFTLNGKFYLGAGLTPWFAAQASFYCFNPNNESWQAITSLPPAKERQYAVGFASNKNGYVFGGLNDTNYLRDLWQYNPIIDYWQQKASLPAAGRSGSTGFVINDTAYIFGGRTASAEAINEVWGYCFTSNSWTNLGTLPAQGSWRGTASTYQQKAYAQLGQDSLGQASKLLYRYTPPPANTWAIVDTLPFGGISYSQMVIIGSSLAFIAGMDSLKQAVNNVWLKNIANNQWTNYPNNTMSARRGGQAFALPPFSVYYSTGIDSSLTRLKETWRLDFPLSQDEVLATQKNIVVYPNPCGDVLTLALNSTFDLTHKPWEIINPMGQIVRKGVFDLNLSINLTNLPTGIYFLNVNNEMATQFVKS